MKKDIRKILKTTSGVTAGLASAALIGKGLYHGIKGARMSVMPPDEVRGFITHRSSDPNRIIASVNQKDLDRQIKLIDSDAKAKATKDKDVIKAYKNVQFGANAYAKATTGKYNYIIAPKKVNKDIMMHEIGHLRKGTTAHELDKKKFLFSLKPVVKEEEAAWEFAHHYIGKKQEHDDILNTYRKPYQYQKSSLSFLSSMPLAVASRKLLK